MSKLFTLLSIIPTKLNLFFPLMVMSTGTSNPCPSNHLLPPPSSQQKGNRMIDLAVVKKSQSPANLRSSPNSPVLGDQTLPTQYEMEIKPCAEILNLSS